MEFPEVFSWRKRSINQCILLANETFI